MTRKTSIDAFVQIQREGLLSKRRFEVYFVLYHYGPLTQNETSKLVMDASQRSITPRFAELERSGVIEVVGKKLCNITGRRVTLWDVTASIPRKIKKQKQKCTHCKGSGFEPKEK